MVSSKPLSMLVSRVWCSRLRIISPVRMRMLRLDIDHWAASSSAPSMTSKLKSPASSLASSVRGPDLGAPLPLPLMSSDVGEHARLELEHGHLEWLCSCIGGGKSGSTSTSPWSSWSSSLSSSSVLEMSRPCAIWCACWVLRFCLVHP